jgi:hypothetical protein
MDQCTSMDQYTMTHKWIQRQKFNDHLNRCIKCLQQNSTLLHDEGPEILGI